MLVWIPTDASTIQQPFTFIDEVKICNTASERAHNLQGENMNTGPDLGWRDARNGWISYDLKIDPERPVDFITKQWGSDGGNRRYNIYCDGTVFSYDELNGFAPNEYYFMRHAIPFELTKGKEKVTIKMQSINAENVVGGVFGIYTALSEGVPDSTIPVDYFWTTQASSRTEHSYSSNGSRGTFRNRTWLDGSGTVGQKWTMKVNPTNRNYLMLLYWGDEGDERKFNIMCDDVFVASETLLHNDPGRFIMRCYPIPEEATSGKESVQIHLSSSSGTMTGGFYYAYMMSAKDDGTGILTPDPSLGRGEIYNLLGQQMPEPQPGINIIGGKKIAIQ